MPLCKTRPGRETFRIEERSGAVDADGASDEVTAETVGPRCRCPRPPRLFCAGTGPLADRVRAFEKQTILAELKRNSNQISNTARALGLERSHLYKKAEQVGLT